MFRTIRAKYAGSVCRRCGNSITLGEKFRYGGPGRCYHLAAECPAGVSQERPVQARGSSYTRFSSGAEVYTNYNGRCEDAPCCGCCS
jgi:hypothetical protein